MLPFTLNLKDVQLIRDKSNEHSVPFSLFDMAEMIMENQKEIYRKLEEISPYKVDYSNLKPTDSLSSN